MKLILKIPTFLFLTFLFANCLKAQMKRAYNFNAKIHQSMEDSLLNQFQNTIYNTFYNPEYMSNNTPIATMMKVDINWEGKVTSISFSDSADSIFVRAFKNHPKWYDDKATLEKYAKVKSLTNISLLIPVNYEPGYPHQRKTFSYDELEGLMKFNKKSFTGKSIVFEPVNIVVLARGNM
jgi:hypothetical protein